MFLKNGSRYEGNENLIPAGRVNNFDRCVGGFVSQQNEDVFVEFIVSKVAKKCEKLNRNK